MAPDSSSAEVPWIGPERMATLVSMADAIDAIETTFLTPSAGTGDPLRTVVDLEHGQLLLMPSGAADVAGVKMVTVAPDNADHGLPRIQGVYVLLDAETLSPVALMDGIALTNLRTPATSAVSIRHCATPDASHLVVFGSGPQAWGHVEAMAAVRPLRRVGIVARHPDRIEAIVERVRTAGWEGYVATPEDASEADVVCLCTTAREPLIEGSSLGSSAHVVAMGTHEPTAREVDTETVRRAAVVVETREAAFAEAGDLILAIAEGAVDERCVVADLHELVTGSGPTSEQFTLFKSVGLATEDLAVARLVYQRYRAATHR